MPTIGESIDRINTKYNREIEKLQSDRQKELTAVLAESGIGLPEAPKRRGRKPGPKPGSKRKKRTTKKVTATAGRPKTTGKGRGKRLKKADKAKLVDEALTLFNKKPGQKYSRSDIAGALKVKPTQVQTILKEVKGLKSEGNKATTVYFVR